MSAAISGCRHFRVKPRGIARSPGLRLLRAYFVGALFAAANLALMGVADTPVRAHTVERLLLDEPVGENIFTAAAEQAATELDPDSDIHASAQYRRDVAGVLINRALHKAAARAHQGDQI